MNKHVDQWSLDYYMGALFGMEKEVNELDERAGDLAAKLKEINVRFLQFKAMFEHLATGPWQPMETAPKDGTAILLKLDSTLCQVCYWDTWPIDEGRYDSGWIINGYSVAVLTAAPVAWAKIL